LEEPYGPRLSVLLGKGPSFARHAEDRDKLVVMVLGGGYIKTERMEKSILQDWGLYFTFGDNAVTVRDDGTGGPNCVNVIRFTDKYRGDQKTLLKVVGQLTKASLMQNTSPKTS